MIIPARETRPFYGWINTGILFTIFALMGIVNLGYAVIFPEMILDMRWGRGQASIAYSLNAVLTGFLSPVIAVSINKIGAKKTIHVGLAFMITGLLLLGIKVNEIWQWILIWGVFIAVGNGFTGLLPVQTTVMHWFNVKRATVLGIVMSAGAMGGFVAQPLFTFMMNRVQSWRIAWLAAAAFSILAMMISFRLKNKPSDVGQHPDGINPNDTERANVLKKSARTYRTAEIWGLRDIIKKPVLWCTVIVGGTYTMAIVLVISHGVLHLMDKGYTQMQSATFLSILIFASGVARFSIGWIGDRIEPRWIIFTSMLLLFITFLGIWSAGSITWLMVTAPVFGFCFGSLIVILSVMIGNYFGPDAFANIGAVIGPILIIFAAVVPVAGGYIAERTGDYNLVFLCLSLTLFLGVVFSLMLKPPQR
ncbi:MAG: MFS transporter [Desulfobacterales bacterium]